MGIVMPEGTPIQAERGSMLIEVIVSGLLLAMLAVGLFGAFDGSARVSVRTKERATAARLAQADQERLRGLPIIKISNLNETTTKVVDGVTYSIATTTDWVSDESADLSCAAGDIRADTLKIKSTATANKPGAAKPVVIDSLLTPPVGTYGPGQGSLAVEILDRDERGIADLPVNLAGAAADTDTTNAKGCAFFGYKPAGTYTASFSRAGYVDWTGVTNVSLGASISARQVSTKSVRYDRAGTADVTFDTDEFGTVRSTTYDAVRFGHSKLGAARQFDNGSPAATVRATNLFPFTDGYGVYAGECDANLPTGTLPTVVVPRGGNGTVKVRLPAMGIVVYRTNTSTGYGAGVRVRVTSPCGGTPQTYTTDSSSVARDANGRLPALPYGTYSICVDNTTVGGLSRRSQSATLANDSAGGNLAYVPLEYPPTGTSEPACG